MKKSICCILMFVIMFSFSACGGESDKTASTSSDTYDVDLTQLSSTMVYSEVYNMMTAPDEYIGKTVKMNGQFATYQDPKSKKMYYAVIIADATACCTQGLEFILAGNHTYPDDYPKTGTEITVAGTFQTYDDNGNMYCHLTDAEML